MHDPGRPEPAGAVVLVEGRSDRAAIEALAARRGHDLDAEGTRIVVTDGATGIGPALARLDPRRTGIRVAGLCDEAEEPHVRRALGRAGLGTHPSRPDLERLGFFTCVADLEDELVRALGATAVEGVLDAAGELRSFRRFQEQPAWRGRPPGEQLRRFIGTRSGRKVRYGRLLVDALDLTRVPRPLQGVLDHVGAVGPHLQPEG